VSSVLGTVVVASTTAPSPMAPSAAATAPGTQAVRPVPASTAPPEPPTFADAWRPGERGVEGLLTFRGNPQRAYHGSGPVPSAPIVGWSAGPFCRSSTAKHETKEWCGAGWTGQPAVVERGGRTWVIFNAYDGAVHFHDARTGEQLLEPFVTGDIIKGSVTVDPDGFPLVYTGSRDDHFRVLALDRPGGRAIELWRLGADAVSPTMWNDDWDGSALVLDDWLLEGGENSQFHVVRLNRAIGADGLVTVAPELVFHTPGWDEQLLRDLAGNRSRDVSIENSVAVHDDTAYFANSGGLVQGWDLSPLRTGGTPTRTFRYWAGDDIDASIVIDDEGMLYVGVEYERGTARAREVGQVIKLDPQRADDPLVWSVKDLGTPPTGVWSTLALHRGVVIATTDGGRVLGIDAADGEILWERRLPGPLWQSPVVVDDVLVLGDCAGVLRGFDVSDPRVEPVPRWEVALGGCIEATPAVWDGWIHLATRGGRFFALADPTT
jgi:outer membrane protein assembly factor BamB